MPTADLPSQIAQVDILAHPLTTTIVGVVLAAVIAGAVYGWRQFGKRLDDFDSKLDRSNLDLVKHMGIEEAQRAAAEAREHALVASVARVEQAIGALHARLDGFLGGHRER